MLTQELATRLINEWPTFLIYTISFIIIGTWWMNHHQIFQHINKADLSPSLLNLLFLFCVTLGIPFQTALIIQYPESPVAVTFYAFIWGFCRFCFRCALSIMRPKIADFQILNFPRQLYTYFIMREAIVPSCF